MFIAIPLENKPSWRNPPWLTMLLILINVIIYWGPQHSEEVKIRKAEEFYFATKLPTIEMPVYIEFLRRTQAKQLTVADQLLQKHMDVPLLEMMESDTLFTQQLDTADGNPKSLVSAESPSFADWQTMRRAYLKLKPPPFTARWAQAWGTGITNVSWTWLTCAFLHGSPGHLIGNMVFLFLFGFSVEIALGRARYLTFYILGAMGSAAFCAFAYASKTGHGLGASGAISCVMVLYAMMYKLRSIKFFYLIFFYFNYVRAPALILVPLWIGNELVSWVFVHSNVAYAAHVGGMLTGLVLTKWMPAQELLDQALTASPETPKATAASLAMQAQALVGKMQWLPACETWQKALSLSPHDESILRRYFNTARHARNDAHLQYISQAIFAEQSVQSHVVELQKECWRWCKKHAAQLLTHQEPALLTMAQRWAATGGGADASLLMLDLKQASAARAP